MNPAVVSVLVVDVARVLDESAPGKRGAAALMARFEAARAQHEKLKARGTTERGKRQADDAAEAFQDEAIAELERERFKLRAEVLAQARPIIEALMKERQAVVVVEAAACLAFAAAVDVTDDVVKRLA